MAIRRLILNGKTSIDDAERSDAGVTCGLFFFFAKLRIRIKTNKLRSSGLTT